MRGILSVLTLLASIAWAAVPASAQTPHVRQGFWLNVGLGYGSLGCENCDSREGALSGQFGIGGTLSQKVIIGLMTNGWTKSEDGVTLSVGTAVAGVRFYPSATGGFYLTGGIGVGAVSAEISGFETDNEMGTGVMLGLGWDFRVGRNVSLTPFWNGYAVSSDEVDANVGQIGLSVTVH